MVGGVGDIRSSLLEEESLRALCRKFNIPEQYKPACAGDYGRACKAPPGSICVYENALDAGMRIPLQPFYCEVLRHYGIAPSQLYPNAWRNMVAFAVHCTNVGVKPRVSLFCFFFTIAPCRRCWLNFVPRTGRVSDSNRSGRRLLSNDQNYLRDYQNSFCKVRGVSSCDVGWKDKYFFLFSPTGDWPHPVNWGKRKYSYPPELGNESENDVEKLCMKEEVGPMSFLSRHKYSAAIAPAAMGVQMVSAAGTKVIQTENDSGIEAASTGSATSKRKSPATSELNPVAGPPPGDNTSSRLSSNDERGENHVHGDDNDAWFKKVKDGFGAALDVMRDENALLRKELAEAREAAKVEIAKARETENAAKAEIARVRKAAKAEVSKARESEMAAKAELAKVREAAKAEVAEAKKSETAAKAELTKVRESQYAGSKS